MAKQEFSQDFDKLPSISDLVKIMAEDPTTAGKYYATLRELMDAYEGTVLAKRSELVTISKILPTDPAPTVPGLYEFAASGTCTWITAGAVNVNKDDNALVYKNGAEIIREYRPYVKLAQELGDSESVGVSQKTVTNFIYGKIPIEGYFIATGGYIYPNSNYHYIESLNFKKGDEIKFSGLSQNLQYGVAAVCFYSGTPSEETFISYLDISSFGSIVNIDETNTPENCKYIRVGGLNTSEIIIVGGENVKGLKLQQDINDKRLSDLESNSIADFKTVETSGYMLATGGYIYPNSNYKYVHGFKFNKGDLLKVSGLSQNLHYNVAAICFYSGTPSEETFISYLDISSFGSIVNIDETNTPENCKYIMLGSEIGSNIVYYLPFNLSGYKKVIEKVLNSANYDNVFISLPSHLSIVVGETLEIFNRSIINAFNYKNYNVSIQAVSGTPKFQNKGRKWTYTPTAEETFTIKMQLLNESGIVISETQNCVVEAFAKKTSPISKINVLRIGDSFTDQIVMPLEIQRRLTGTGGNPTADGLTNINFIGTRHISENCPNEGWSGKDYNWFCGSESPFWNGSTSDVDFNLYMTNLIANHGSELNITTGDKIDYAIIMLGTNKANNETTIKKIWDKLIAHNPNIKILVTGRIWASTIGIGFAGGVAYNANEWDFNSQCLQYNRKLESWINDLYPANMLFVDVQCQFDSEYNFPFNNEPVNKRNSDITERIGSDCVHPSQNGYWQIADAFYSAFHAFI